MQYPTVMILPDTQADNLIAVPRVEENRNTFCVSHHGTHQRELRKLRLLRDDLLYGLHWPARCHSRSRWAT